MDLISRLRLLATFGQGMARGLPDASSERDPIALLREWYEAAEHAGLFLPEALALATSTPDGAPSVRMVLLKGLDAGGLVFYTNFGSRKARELDENPRAAMCFHWGVLQRQVRVSGPVARIPAADSDALREIRFVNAGFSTSSSRIAASWSARPGSNKTPFTPSSISSGMPPDREATTTVPAASDS